MTILKEDYERGLVNLAAHLDDGKLSRDNLPTDIRAVMPISVGVARQSKKGLAGLVCVPFEDLRPEEILGIAYLHMCLSDGQSGTNIFVARPGLFEAALFLSDHEIYGFEIAVGTSERLFAYAIEHGLLEEALTNNSFLLKTRDHIELDRLFKPLKRLRPIALQPSSGGKADPADCKSWIGGQPRLGGLAWPRNEKTGKPLRFFVQIDCGELSGNSKSNLLPRQGAIAFFIAADSASQEAKVLHVPEPAKDFALVPDDLSFNDADEFCLIHSLTKSKTLPFSALEICPLDVDANAGPQEIEEAYRKSFDPEEPVRYQMFGLEKEIQGVSPAFEHHLLLQITGRSGFANFWISQTAFENLNFDEAFVTFDYD